MRVLRFVLALILMSPLLVGAENVKHHINYGTTFSPRGSICFSTEAWRHSFLIDIGKPFHIPAFPFCAVTARTSNSSICAAKNRLAFAVNAIRTELGHHLNDTVKLLEQLLPNTVLPKDVKKKRAIFSFLGSIIHDITGLSTEEQMQQVQGQINLLKKAISTVGNTLTREGSELSSFMNALDDRLTNAMNGVQENALQTQTLALEFHNATENLERLSFLISANIVKELANVQTITHQYDLFKQSLADLAEGKLSPLLIKPALIRQTITNIQGILTRDYPNFFLVSTNPQYYYKHAKFLVYRKNSHILITVYFPISSVQTFELFRVYSWPSPVNETTSEATQIRNLPDYFAISNDRQFFVSLTNEETSHCVGNEIQVCTFRPTMQSISSTNCVANLFLGNVPQIKQQCDFRFLSNVIKPHLLNIGNGQLIVYQTPRIIIECPPNRRHVMPGCNFCLIHLQCGCLAISEDILFQSSITQCQSSAKQVTKLYPVNLALLHHFFNDHELQEILANTTFEKPLSIILPQLHVYKHKMSDIVSADHQFDLSLKTIIEKTKNQSKIYGSIADAYLDGQFSIIDSSPFDYKLLLNIIAITLSVLNAIMLFFLFKKIKMISALLLASHTAHALSPKFHYVQNSTPRNNVGTDHDFIIDTLQWDHVIFLVCMLTLITMVLFLLYKAVTKNTSSTNLLLEICNAHNCVNLEIFKLASCPYFYDIQCPDLISQITIIGFYRPQLVLKFSNFKIVDYATGKQVEVPEKVGLSWIQAYKLQSVLKSPFFAHIVIQHQNCAYVMNKREISPASAPTPPSYSPTYSIHN